MKTLSVIHLKENHYDDFCREKYTNWFWQTTKYDMSTIHNRDMDMEKKEKLQREILEMEGSEDLLFLSDLRWICNDSIKGIVV